MPIKGYSDLAPAFPRLGELRKGDKKPAKGNRPGRDLGNKFRFTSNIDGMEQLFFSEFGNAPNNILCYLPYKTTDENFIAWEEEWVAGGLKWRGDGETIHIWQRTDGTYSTEKKPQPQRGKPSGKLNIIIPALRRSGYVVVLTTSINDIMEVTANLRAYESFNGDLRGIPFILSRVPRKISTPTSDGKRARREKWLLHIETVPDYTQAQLELSARRAMPQIVGTTMPALNSGEIDYETGEIIPPPQLENDPPADEWLNGNDEPPFVPDEPEPPAALETAGRTAVEIATALIEAAGSGSNPPTAPMLSKVQKDLSKVCMGNKNAKMFIKSVFNADSSKDLSYGQVKALLDWIGSNKENGWVVSPTATAEAAVVLKNE